MKRPSSTGSLVGAGDGGLLQVCACPPEEKRAFARVGSFHSILDGLGEEEEDEMMMMGGEGGRVGLSLSPAEKKRRLSIDQVKALEKNFEVENKLQPERKAKLAQELGLQPRQVAVWFQNRRARWKTKQIERDYGILKANYDALKSNYDALVHDKESLLAEFKELKLKLAGDGESSYCSIKEEPVVGGEEKQVPTPQKTSITATAATTGVGGGLQEQDEEDAPPLIYKDGSSDSDSSAILNDFSSPSRVVQSHQKQLQDEFTGFNYTSSSTSSPFQYHDGGGNGLTYQYYQHQEEEKQAMLMMDETEFGPCSSGFFSDEQPSSLTWYCPHQWD